MSYAPEPMRPVHGGRLRIAAARYRIPFAQWIDLSTGINPRGWRVGAVPPSVWRMLPEDDDGLETAACDYYEAATVLPTAGTQAAIQTLPRLRPPCRVAVLHPGYAEHAYAWRHAGHLVKPTPADALDCAVTGADVLVIVHPNNPTGTRFTPPQLLEWHRRLSARGGWLIVDEAFIDATPDDSIARFAARRGLIVLRSLGKFFGLAGARVGFVCAETSLLDALRAALGPWCLAGPARFVAAQALADHTWQRETRHRLRTESFRLAQCLDRHGLAPRGGCALFQWTVTPRAAELHELLARRGILTRYFDEPSSLRFGLPATEADWTRLDSTLAEIGAGAPQDAHA